MKTTTLKLIACALALAFSLPALAQFRRTSDGAKYPYTTNLNDSDVFIVGRPGDTNYNIAASNVLAAIGGDTGGGEAFWWTNSAMASGISNAFHVGIGTMVISNDSSTITTFWKAGTRVFSIGPAGIVDHQGLTVFAPAKFVSTNVTGDPDSFTSMEGEYIWGNKIIGGADASLTHNGGFIRWGRGDDPEMQINSHTNYLSLYGTNGFFMSGGAAGIDILESGGMRFPTTNLYAFFDVNGKLIGTNGTGAVASGGSSNLFFDGAAATQLGVNTDGDAEALLLYDDQGANRQKIGRTTTWLNAGSDVQIGTGTDVDSMDIGFRQTGTDVIIGAGGTITFNGLFGIDAAVVGGTASSSAVTNSAGSGMAFLDDITGAAYTNNTDIAAKIVGRGIGSNLTAYARLDAATNHFTGDMGVAGTLGTFTATANSLDVTTTIHGIHTNLYAIWDDNGFLIGTNSLASPNFINPTNPAVVGQVLHATSTAGASKWDYVNQALTNSNPVRPDFNLPVNYFSTNAAFVFLTPANVDTTGKKVQVTDVTVNNSTASAWLVTFPANVHFTGTPYVTNETDFHWKVTPWRTNVVCEPVY